MRFTTLGVGQRVIHPITVLNETATVEWRIPFRVIMTDNGHIFNLYVSLEHMYYGVLLLESRIELTSFPLFFFLRDGYHGDDKKVTWLFVCLSADTASYYHHHHNDSQSYYNHIYHVRWFPDLVLEIFVMFVTIIRTNNVCLLDGRHSNFRFHNDLQNVLYHAR